MQDKLIRYGKMVNIPVRTTSTKIFYELFSPLFTVPKILHYDKIEVSKGVDIK